jgi:hypothetical protein
MGFNWVKVLGLLRHRTLQIPNTLVLGIGRTFDKYGGYVVYQIKSVATFFFSFGPTARPAPPPGGGAAQGRTFLYAVMKLPEMC